MPWICLLSSGFPITRPDQHQDLQAARFRATEARPIESTEGAANFRESLLIPTVAMRMATIISSETSAPMPVSSRTAYGLVIPFSAVADYGPEPRERQT